MVGDLGGERRGLVTLKDRKSSDELINRVSVNIRNFIQRDKLRWFGHVERMNNDSWLKQCREIVVKHRANLSVLNTALPDSGQSKVEVSYQVNLSHPC